MQINPYLSFNGTCAEAFKFYAQVLGGENVMMMTYGESPMAAQTAPEHKDRIMHARLNAGDIVLMGADAPPQFYTPMQGMVVSLSVEAPAEADRIFTALSANGTVKMPIGETFWAQRFGMLIDRFGTPWMINCEKPDM